MSASLFRPIVATATGLMAAGLLWGAESIRSATPAGARASAAGRPGASPRGLLPDPVLLDGSTHAAEKKSEYGMIGDFELPGDENAPKGKVGGGSGSEQPQNGETPQGGGGGKPDQAAKPGGGGAAKAAEQVAGAAQEGKEGGAKSGAANEPPASAQGIKVAELGGEPSGSGPQDGMQKPPPVAIGDKAMRIPQSAQNPTVVGAQQVASQNTQVYEKGTGTGGKGPTGVQGPNRTEKGRVIPSGL